MTNGWMNLTDGETLPREIFRRLLRPGPGISEGLEIGAPVEASNDRVFLGDPFVISGFLESLGRNPINLLETVGKVKRVVKTRIDGDFL